MENSVIERIREIIKYKGMTPRAFAIAIGFNYSTLNNYLTGRRTSIDLNLLVRIESTFDEISSEWMLTGKGHMLKFPPIEEDASEEESKEELEDGLFLVTPSGNKYYEFGGRFFKMRVPLVPYYAYGRYLSDTGEAMTMERDEWEEVDFIVDRIAHGRYLAFEIKGESMNDGSRQSIADGDIVLARELDRNHWRTKLRFKDYPYWVVVTDDSILCKEVIAHDPATGMITFHSINPSPEYRDFTLHVDEIKQLFNVVKKTITAF
ncbi:helix-turn-helix domain-containing protein [Bacteroides sp. OttesenSCG-928-D19]|nr:helix-turn-helix domain-containing protein [Bacteroides sp. OttesenSCG-928-N06]MDL2305634.1 helix-turn-helix domain-containing protein [Bacteroides sp. OttesenSCG-928-D19]